MNGKIIISAMVVTLAAWVAKCQCTSGDCENGYGTKIDSDGNSYTGQFKNGSYHGWGTLSVTTGAKYIGEFFNDAMHGIGVIYGNDGEYLQSGLYKENNLTTNMAENTVRAMVVARTAPLTGSTSNQCAEGNCENGFGVSLNTDESSYAGNFKNGMMHGWGNLKTKDGAHYFGEFVNDNMEGYGIIYGNDGEYIQSGIYKENALETSMDEQEILDLIIPSEELAVGDMGKTIPKTSGISDVDREIPVASTQQSKYFAVVIGNENYENEIQVKYAKHDARIFKSYLEQTIGIPDKNIHYIENGTYGKMLSEIKWITSIIEAFNGEARIYFYYAGHGMPDEKTKSAYLLPVDGNSTMMATAVSLEELYADLTEFPSESVTVFLDACFSGASRDGMLTEGRGVRIKPKEEAVPGNMVVFSAASGDQTAYPHPEQKHGMFTYYLLKKLKETNGSATYKEMAEYLRNNVNQQAIIINSKSQQPQVNSEMAGWETLRFK